MNKNPDREMKDFVAEIADALGRRRRDNPIKDHGGSRDFKSKKSQRKTLMLGGALTLLLLILFAVFYRGGSELSPEDLSSVQARLGQLEKTRARLQTRSA